MELYKCSICNLILESVDINSRCLKCGAPYDNMVLLNEEVTNNIYKANKTNALLMKLVGLTEEIIQTSENGINENLDKGCISTFVHCKDVAYNIRQFCKAELETHVKKDKF